MRKFFSINILLALALGFITFSCGKSDEKPSTEQKIAGLMAKADSLLPNYRYVDIDTVLFYYNLAKDYNEEMLRMQNNMQAELKRHETNLQSKATAMQNKLQNNIYLSEASYQADQKEYLEEQNKAQRAVTALQTNFENTAIVAQKTVSDSIEAYILEYNLTKGYDAIFYKAATLYINPALDITAEIIEGLNARYNKVK